MPWLLVHLTVPLVFLTAKLLGNMLDNNVYLLRESYTIPTITKLFVPVFLVAITIIFMFSVSLRVNFSNTGIPTEPLIYTQTSPDNKALGWRNPMESALDNPFNKTVDQRRASALMA